MSLVYRPFPLPIHNNSLKASLAAESAGEPNKFFEMHDLLFENQAEWSEEGNPDKLFEKYASDLKLDMDKYKDDMKTKKYDTKVKSDQADGNAAGVNSTPTFFISGAKQASGFPYDQFKAKIEAALK